jgi:hypothetical protein
VNEGRGRWDRDISTSVASFINSLHRYFRYSCDVECHVMRAPWWKGNGYKLRVLLLLGRQITAVRRRRYHFSVRELNGVSYFPFSCDYLISSLWHQRHNTPLPSPNWKTATQYPMVRDLLAIPWSSSSQGLNTCQYASRAEIHLHTCAKGLKQQFS